MARIREGVEIPIIPEDFESADEDRLSDAMESCLKESARTYQDELYAVEWAIVESFFDQRSQG
jgi:hypothetical protein